MASAPHDKEEKQAPPDRSTVLLLLGTMVDTTWRMFVPTAAGGLMGWWGDSIWHTAPWLSIAGVALGAVVAGALIWQQLKQVDNDK